LTVIAEEFLFSKYKLHSLKMTGLEGAFGLLILLIPLVIFGILPCGENEFLDCYKGAFVKTT